MYSGRPSNALASELQSLLAGFLLVCAAECCAGWLLWGGHRAGAILALTLLSLGALYWWGFALPLPPLFALVRTLLIVRAWSTLV